MLAGSTAFSWAIPGPVLKVNVSGIIAELKAHYHLNFLQFGINITTPLVAGGQLEGSDSFEQKRKQRLHFRETKQGLCAVV
jgi:hypothetical protein